MSTDNGEATDKYSTTAEMRMPGGGHGVVADFRNLIGILSIPSTEQLLQGSTIRRTSRRLRELGDRLTGGGVRALFRRIFGSPRHAGELETFQPPEQESDSAYHRWIATNDTIGDLDRRLILTHIAGLPYRPLISVIVAMLDRSSEVALRESFDSLIRQLYPYWELCLTIDQCTEPLLSRVLRRFPDPRIKVIDFDNPRGTTAAINAAFSLATGEYVTVLRSGDTLPEQSLYEVAFEVGRNEGTDIVYTDNDELGPDGNRSRPWFKPGWDPDLLLAQDYLSSLAVYRRSLVEGVEFLRPGFEGAEFHDLALRATAATTPDRIRHIPAILYRKRDEDKAIHWENPLLGLRATTAAHRAVRDHLDSQGDKEAILKPVPLLPAALRVVWPVPTPEPLVSVIIPTRDHADLLSRCVEGVLQRTEYSNLELLIVDNESIETDTLELLDRLTHRDGRVRILHHRGPFNYSALNNAAAKVARGEILLLLNNDVDVIDPGWLRELVSQAIRPGVGLVGAMLLYATGQVQHAGIVLGPEGRATHLHRSASRNDPGYFGQLALSRTLSAVTGACAAIRRAVFFEVGGFDEANLPVTFNDIDLCLRLGDYGYRVVWTPVAELFHVECASRGLDNFDPAKSERFLRELQHMRNTWGSLMESADPFHNPNLLFTDQYFEIPSLPRRAKPWRPVFDQVTEGVSAKG